MSAASLAHDLRALSASDRALLKAMIALALLALAFGIGYGAATAAVRAGFIVLDPESGYRMMTLHGVTIFFYWLYFGQTALLLGLTVVHARRNHRLALAPAAWIGFALMVAGLVASQAGSWMGTPLLYDGSPEIVGEEKMWAGVFYVGYLLLGLGLFLLASAAIATALAGKREDPERAWSTIGFGTVTWAGLLMVSAVATLNAFAPAALWALGWGEMPADHSTGWHILFHNLHYLPLMGTVLAWYALVREMTGVGSIFGDRFSKVVFAFYLVFVPPTSLYHMFLEPGLAPLVLALGSLLSLFISVPTVAVFLVIVISLEAHARARGARGMFGWVRMLPWREPAMSAIGMAVINLALGGALAFVLIQERLAQLLSDTFFVPGYFHFLTVGTVSLTLLGALARMIPALSHGRLLAPRLLAVLPLAVTAGLVVFGLAGIAAGLIGMPRRVLDASYDGAAPAAWGLLSVGIGIGGVLMAAALLMYVFVLGQTLLMPARAEARPAASADILVAPDQAALRQAAWSAPLSVLILVVAMYAMTAVAFAVMRGLPLLEAGTAAH